MERGKAATKQSRGPRACGNLHTDHHWTASKALKDLDHAILSSASSRLHTSLYCQGSPAVRRDRTAWMEPKRSNGATSTSNLRLSHWHRNVSGFTCLLAMRCAPITRWSSCMIKRGGLDEVLSVSTAARRSSLASREERGAVAESRAESGANVDGNDASRSVVGATRLESGRSSVVGPNLLDKGRSWPPRGPTGEGELLGAEPAEVPGKPRGPTALGPMELGAVEPGVEPGLSGQRGGPWPLPAGPAGPGPLDCCPLGDMLVGILGWPLGEVRSVLGVVLSPAVGYGRPVRNEAAADERKPGTVVDGAVD